MALEKSINKILMVILLVTPFLITPGYLDDFYFIKVVFVFVGTMLILFKWFLYEKDKIEQIKNMTDAAKLGIGYYTLMCISTFFSLNPVNSVFGLETRWEGLILLACYLLLMIFASFYLTLKDQNLKALVFAGCIMAFIGMLQFIGVLRDSFYHFELNEVFARSFGTLGNPNFLGNYLTFIIGISVFLYYIKSNYFYLASSAFLYAVLLTTSTRGSWLGAFFAVAILMFYFVKKKKVYRRTVYLAVAIMVVTIAMDLLLNGIIIMRLLSIVFEFQDVLGPGPADPSGGSFRIELWTAVLAAIPQRPFFGVGVANLNLILEQSPIYDNVIFAKAHNDYLNAAATTGIPSAIVYLLMYVKVIKTSFTRLRSNQNSIMMLAVLAGHAVQSFFSSSVVAYSFIVWIMLGYAAKTETEQHQLTEQAG